MEKIGKARFPSDEPKIYSSQRAAGALTVWEELYWQSRLLVAQRDLFEACTIFGAWAFLERSGPTAATALQIIRACDDLAVLSQPLAQPVEMQLEQSGPCRSAVDREKAAEDEKVWQVLSPVPPEGSRFLRRRIGLRFERTTCTFQAVAGVDNGTLGETGSLRVVGRLEFRPAKASILPSPTGGSVKGIGRIMRRRVVYSINGGAPAAAVSRVLSLPV